VSLGDTFDAHTASGIMLAAEASAAPFKNFLRLISLFFMFKNFTISKS
jgi:hypothetical protein